MAIALGETKDQGTRRRSFARLPQILEVPNLLQMQLNSYRRFLVEGLAGLLKGISPIKDFTESRFELSFVDPKTGKPCYGPLGKDQKTPKLRFNIQDLPEGVDIMEELRRVATEEQPEGECRAIDKTYAFRLGVTTWLRVKETDEIKEQTLFMGRLPVMTRWGSFIVNGAERVVVSQLIRSPGVYFTLEKEATSGRELAFAKLIPDRGAWLEFETTHHNALAVRTNGMRRIYITTLFLALGYPEERLAEFFQDIDTGEKTFVQATLERTVLEREEVHTKRDALLTIYKKLRPGDPPNEKNAEELLFNLLFNPRRYDLGAAGRYKLNLRLGRGLLWAGKLLGTELAAGEPFELSPQEVQRLVAQRFAESRLTHEDLIAIIRHMVRLNKGAEAPDDIDHLGNRRVRTIGELLQSQFRIGLLRLERVVRERMSLVDPKAGASAVGLVNVRPVEAAIREFFGGSQLSQFMDQTNPVAEITHKRRLSAMGPGGLSRERAGVEVRDVHPSHYGRICPVETPEGPNIGLIGSLATYSRVNPLGFIETPLRRVYRELDNRDEKGKPNRQLLGHTLRERVVNKERKVVAEAGTVVDEELLTRRLGALAPRKIAVTPFASSEAEYLSAHQEEEMRIAQPHLRLDPLGQFLEERVEVRHEGRYYMETPLKVDYVDVSPQQIVSATTALIPFLEHDDANRALMGSNMQRQAVPLVAPEAPVVGTGMERVVGRDSGLVVLARRGGTVTQVTATEVQVLTAEAEVDSYPLMKFRRTNQGTCVNQRPIVSIGQRVGVGQVLADDYSTEGGELALGQNVLVAFMCWEGYNYEDAIVISERLVKEDKFTSVHIERYEVEARETKLGDEEITRDIPNVGEESLRHLDEEGIIRIGAEVGPGDILVGKITPKGEAELSPEEKLLRAIFGEKARDVKDTSLRVPHGEGGKVITVRVTSREKGDELGAGVIQTVRLWLAQKRKLSVGDKMAGRHGNKGVISLILPEADMPFLPDGRAVDIILNPIGVPSRMNLGQILETHLAIAAHTLGYRALCPAFDGARSSDIEEALCQAWLALRAGAVDPFTGTANLEKAVITLREWGYDGEKVFSQNSAGEARRLALCLWLQDQGVETAGQDPQAVDKEVGRVMAEKGALPPTMGKVDLRDGRSGRPFDQPVTVGSIYMMKLIHLVEDKIHARSTGPYSLITQQPLGGKAQFGGQRFGEMEVWALEAYGAAYNLQELLTVKSDDVSGRSRIYEAIVKGEEVVQAGLPESFKVLVQELKSLGLAVEVLQEDERALAEESLVHRRLSADI